jgi:predicted esterase
MDDIGSRQAVLWGFSQGAPMSALFAATAGDGLSSQRRSQENVPL